MIFWKRKKEDEKKNEEPVENKLPAKSDNIEQVDKPEAEEQPQEPKSDIIDIVEAPQSFSEEESLSSEPPKETKKSWAARLTAGLSKSSKKISGGITDVFTKAKLDSETLDELEELLVAADLGPMTAAKLRDHLEAEKFDKDITADEVKEILRDRVAEILSPVAKPFTLDSSKAPYIILVVGVNGTGKTTTIAKFAQQFKDQGKSVLLAAGDTFRAAAVEQLDVWAKRTGAQFISKEIGADAAAVAYEAIDKAKSEGIDVVMIDTAGRLHNKQGLMDELEKIRRVISKHIEDAPHATLITLDATTGQNAINQVDLFNKTTPLTGLIVTKLDGTARGGIVVALAEKFGLPIHAIGVGETAEDLHSFEPKAYATGLIG